MTALEWAMLFALSVLWGGSFFFVGIAVKELPPLTIVVLRVGVAAAMLTLMLRMLGLRLPRGRRAWAAFFGMGLLNNAIPFCLIVWGQTHIASGLAAILNATTTLFTVLVAHVFTNDERITSNRIAGVLVGLAGVMLIIGPGALTGIGSDVLAQLAVLAAALSYAFAGVFGAALLAARSCVTRDRSRTGHRVDCHAAAACLAHGPAVDAAHAGHRNVRRDRRHRVALDRDRARRTCCL